MTTHPEERSRRLALAPHLDPAVVRSVFSRHGRAHVANMLVEQSAIDLLGCLREEVSWRLSCNLGERTASLSEEDVRSLTDVQRLTLEQHFLASAQKGFQYIFANSPIYELWKANQGQPALMVEMVEFLNSRIFLDFARAATGLREIAYADAQATRYGPGHFLTQHDDSVSKPGRLAAFVISLTPRWMPDWGGILQFFDAEGHVDEGYVPKFNSLNLFRVPAPHAVSYVTPFTSTYRYSISGWFWSA